MPCRVTIAVGRELATRADHLALLAPLNERPGRPAGLRYYTTTPPQPFAKGDPLLLRLITSGMTRHIGLTDDVPGFFCRFHKLEE
jgi:hypothetical protein